MHAEIQNLYPQGFLEKHGLKGIGNVKYILKNWGLFEDQIMEPCTHAPYYNIHHLWTVVTGMAHSSRKFTAGQGIFEH